MKHFILSIGATAALIAGCYSQPSVQSGAPPFAGAVPRPQGTWFPATAAKVRAKGWLAPALRHGASNQSLMYVSEESRSEIVIYPEPQPTGKPLGIITDGVDLPWGLCVDRNRNLYVANQSGTVTEYPPGSTSPSATYAEDLGRPLYCIVDQYGDLFVGNAEGGANGGTIVEYKAGSTGAYQVLQTPGNEVDDMDFDADGNLYAAYRGGQGSYGTSIEKFAPGSADGTILGMRLNQPQGLVVDGNGDIVVVTEWRPGRNHLAVFRSGKTRPQLRLRQPHDSYPIQIALSGDELSLLATTFNNGKVYEVDYPIIEGARWQFEQSDHRGLQQGIALSDGYLSRGR